MKRLIGLQISKAIAETANEFLTDTHKKKLLKGCEEPGLYGNFRVLRADQMISMGTQHYSLHPLKLVDDTVDTYPARIPIVACSSPPCTLSEPIHPHCRIYCQNLGIMTRGYRELKPWPEVGGGGGSECLKKFSSDFSKSIFRAASDIRDTSASLRQLMRDIWSTVWVKNGLFFLVFGLFVHTAYVQQTWRKERLVVLNTANMTTYWSESILRVFWWYINISQNIIPQVWS